MFFRVSNLSKYYEFPLSFSKHALVKDNCISKQKYYKKYNYQNQPKLLPVKEQKNEKLVFQPPKNYCNCDDFVCRIQHLQKISTILTTTTRPQKQPNQIKKKRVEELQWWRKTSWNRWYRERKKIKKRIQVTLKKAKWTIILWRKQNTDGLQSSSTEWLRSWIQHIIVKRDMLFFSEINLKVVQCKLLCHLWLYSILLLGS